MWFHTGLSEACDSDGIFLYEMDRMKKTLRNVINIQNVTRRDYKIIEVIWDGTRPKPRASPSRRPLAFLTKICMEISVLLHFFQDLDY